MRKNGQFKIELWCEQSWESFTEFLHSDRPVKIMTLWKRRGRHENFGEVARGRQVRLPGDRFNCLINKGFFYELIFSTTKVAKIKMTYQKNRKFRFGFELKLKLKHLENW